MATLASQSYDGFTDGATITLTAPWSAVGTAPAASAAAAVKGAMGVRWTSTGAFGRIQYDTGATQTAVRVWSFYFNIRTMATATLPIAATLPAVATTAEGDVRLLTSGAIQIRNAGTQVAVSSAAAITAGTTYRADWRVDSTAHTQELRVYVGDSTTPMLDISGAYSSTATSRWSVGPYAAAAGGAVDYDETIYADDWVVVALPSTYTASGSASAISAAAGTITALDAVSGSAAAVSAATGAATAICPTTGGVAAVSDVSGSVTASLAATSQPVTAATAVTGAVIAQLQSAGHVDGISGIAGTSAGHLAVSGEVDVITGSSGVPFAGTGGIIAAVTGSSGTVGARYVIAGNTEVATVIDGQPVKTTSATGTVDVASNLAGAIASLYNAAGTVTITSDIGHPPLRNAYHAAHNPTLSVTVPRPVLTISTPNPTLSVTVPEPALTIDAH